MGRMKIYIRYGKMTISFARRQPKVLRDPEVQRYIREVNWEHRMNDAYYHELPQFPKAMIYSPSEGKWIDVSVPF